jgi:sn-glycerol 3-phosphate transport system substrate-binding protein
MNKWLKWQKGVFFDYFFSQIGSKKLVFLGLFASALSCAAKPIELVLWHGMAGHLGDEVRVLTDEFNHSQQEYIVKPVYKGNYLETFTSFAASFRAHQAPAMVQIFEVGTAMMLSPKGVIKPVDELMREQGLHIPKDDFIHSVREFYSDKGHLMAMPFNLSAPILYYNLDILAKVGYNEATIPKTWQEMEVLAKKVKQAGYDCTYTTAYPGWVLFESYQAIHGLPIIQEHPARAVFNTPQLLAHFQRLKRWSDAHYFRYAGRVDDGTILFTSGSCPMFSQSSGAYNSLAALVPFRLGATTMPLDLKASTIRHANVAGGAALWAVSGQTPTQYKGIAQFFVFLARPEVQRKWHEHTGYLPLGFKGVYASLVQNSQHPTLLLARADLEDNPIGQRINHASPQHQIRGVTDELLEAMFAGLISAQQAMDESIRRSNGLLLRFARNTQEDTRARPAS